MSSNHETLLRQWQMLRYIPRHPYKITARELKEKLDAEDFGVSKRTVERDLQELSLAFPLMLDDRDKPYGWSWQKDAPAFDLPGLSNNEALTMMMVEQHLSNLLPATTMDVLTPYFKAARQHLSVIPNSQHARSWLNKVRTIPANQRLLHPKVKPEVQHTITQALLTDHQLQVSYFRRGDTKPVIFRIHPLALIQRGGLIYLYVRINDYEDTKTLVLHRIESATILEESTVYPKGFNIDDEVAKGRFDFGEGAMIQLKARFNTARGDHLFETPLSKNQTIEEQPDGRLMVAATVADTSQLRWWLLAMGDGVEVIEPASLRAEMAEMIQRMVNNYAVNE